MHRASVLSGGVLHHTTHCVIYEVIVFQRSLVAKFQQHLVPDIGMLFLNLTVRRSFLVYDSLNEVSDPIALL